MKKIEKKQDTKRSNWKAKAKELQAEVQDLKEYVELLRESRDERDEVISKLSRELGEARASYWKAVYSQWGMIVK